MALNDCLMMNDKKRTVLGVGVVTVILAAMFFVPWRIESSDELKWSPIYRQPVTYSQTYETRSPGARYAYDEARIDVGFFLLEILAIGAASATGYVLASGDEKDNHD